MTRVEPGTIAVCGEALVDLVEQEPGLFRAYPGGSPANVAVGLARLGLPVTLLARLSDDTFGRRLREHLSANQVGLTYAVAAAEPATLAAVATDGEGAATYDFWFQGTADRQWLPTELPDPLPDPVVAVHTGSLALALEPAAGVLTDWLRAVRATSGATVCLDPNIRPVLELDRATALRRVERQVRLAHIVKVSAEDLAWLAPDEPADRVARRWRELGPLLVVVTLGADGVLAIGPDGSTVRRPAVPVDVVDTVGAGDAFTAGLLAGLHRLELLGPGGREALAALGPARLAGLLDEAALVAALTCARVGADPPTPAAVRQAERARTPGNVSAPHHESPKEASCEP